MNFHIDQDRGKTISGWFLPDNPSKEPSFLLEADGRSLIVEPTLTHSNMVDAGWHETGLVGFSVTTREWPGLGQAVDLRVTERDSGLTFYTRPKPRSYVPGRMFAFDMREGPDSLTARAFLDGFHIAFPDVHLYGQDTRKVFYQIGYASSVFTCGAPSVRADEPFMAEAHVRRVALLTDPIRLLYNLLLPGVPETDPDGPARLVERIRQLDRTDRQMLSEPLTRRLSLLYVDEALPRDAVALALDTLSGFDALGVEDAVGAFVELVAAVCDVDPSLFAVPAQPEPFALSRDLRREPDVVALVARDLDIYDAAWDAIAESHRAGRG